MSVNNNNSSADNNQSSTINDFQQQQQPANSDQIVSSSSTNLIVNYLPQSMVSEEFHALFEPIGELDQCKLIVDKSTQQNLGYGFVSYVRAADAAEAIRIVNGLKLQNKTLKVSHARPSSDAIKAANLYVCGLPRHLTRKEELDALFAPHGTIIASRVLVDATSGTSKGVGFVRFDKRGEAEMAIAKLNGALLHGATEPIVVKHANYPSLSSPTTTTLHNNSSRSMRHYAQHHHQQQHQQVKPMPRFAVNHYQQQQQQQQQLLIEPRFVVQQKQITSPQQTTPAQLPVAAAAAQVGWCLFVYNLAPETVDESVLWQLFGPFGAVLSVKLVRSYPSKKCKGFGFVTMLHLDEATNAVLTLNNLLLGDRVIQVSFKTDTNTNANWST